jgi:hypothetical protein
MEERRSKLMPVVVALLLALPVLYVGSYLGLVRPDGIVNEAVDDPFPEIRYYRFGDKYAQKLFWPLERLDWRMRHPAPVPIHP